MFLLRNRRQQQQFLLLLCIGIGLQNNNFVGAFLPTASTTSHTAAATAVLLPKTKTKTSSSSYKFLANDAEHRGGGGSRKAEPAAQSPSSTTTATTTATTATTTTATTINVPRIVLTIACTILTWSIQISHQYTNVLSSAALSLVCCMCLDNQKYGQAAFCGSFAGMASLAVIPNWQYALCLGTFTSFFYETLIGCKNAFVGVGGRLGATAFLASLLVAALQGLPTGLVSSLSTLSLASVNLEKSVILSMAFWHAVGSAGTILLRATSDESRATDTVRASATIGLLGALLLKNKSAALAVYGGSFVGMSAPTRLVHGILPSQVKDGARVPDTSSLTLLLSFAVAGALGGIVHGASIGLGWFNGGWGGKAGFCGFVGCLLFRVLRIVQGKVFAF